MEVVHNKTGKHYHVLYDNIIECTNGREDLTYVLYANDEHRYFTRERDEFWQKFHLFVND